MTKKPKEKIRLDLYKLKRKIIDIKKENNNFDDFETSGSKFEPIQYIAPSDFDIGKIHVQKGQELHYILGLVLAPETVDGTVTKDSVGDIYSEDEVRKAAHFFMANYTGNGNDLMHDGKDNNSLAIVESYIAPTDMTLNTETIMKGSWMMATLILDETIWEKIKKGEITGYSIGGLANAQLEASV